MPFKTLQRVLGKEAEPDWVQFQSFVFVHSVLLRVDVECFLDSPLQTVTFAIDHFHIVEIKGMLFEDRMLCSSRHVKSSVFDVGRMLLYAYTGCASRFSNVCLFAVATLETIYNTWVILSTGPIFQLLLERPLPVSWLFNYYYIERPQDSLQGLILRPLNVRVVGKPIKKLEVVAPAAAERSDQLRQWPRCCISSQVGRLRTSMHWRNGTHSLCTHQGARVLRQKRTIWHVCCCGACDLRTACPWFRQCGSDRLRMSRFEAESQGSTPHLRGEAHYEQRQRIGIEPNLVQPLSLTPFGVFLKGITYLVSQLPTRYLLLL